MENNLPAAVLLHWATIGFFGYLILMAVLLGFGLPLLATWGALAWAWGRFGHLLAMPTAEIPEGRPRAARAAGNGGSSNGR